MGRKLARESSMKLIYQMDLREEYSDIIIELYLNEYNHNETDEEFMKRILDNVVENRNRIDSLIEKNIHGWSLNRLSKVDLAILRVAVSEILYDEKIPMEVVINEAVEMAKKFSAEDSYRFINGVLGGVIKTIKEEEVE